MKWLFVNSLIDDWGLSPHEFRVYANLARRSDDAGMSYPSGQSLSDTCRMKRDTVFTALRALEGMGMVCRESRPGGSTVYRLPPPEEWSVRDGGYPPKRDDPKEGIPTQTGRGVSPQTVR